MRNEPRKFSSFQSQFAFGIVPSTHKDIGTRGQFRGKHLRSQISAAGNAVCQGSACLCQGMHERDEAHPRWLPR
jgi:hypothetical protein